MVSGASGLNLASSLCKVSRSSFDGFIFPTLDIQPVSYTHLDVYKRQPPTPEKPNRPSDSPKTGDSTNVMAFIVMLLASAGDVYKRQA